MKKSVIALLLLTVLIIIVSPGLIGKFAEESVGDNLKWAARENNELMVTSQGFDRSWFSSEGQHRIEMKDGALRTAVSSVSGDGEQPVLLINTHIDHGIIPVTSMNREEGSLVPGLGSAVSTLAVEMDGETIALPGTIYSRLGLAGGLDSRYVLEAGSRTVDDGDVSWQASQVNVASNARTGKVDYDGEIGGMSFGNELQSVAIEGLKFSGNQTRTKYGFSVGEISMTMGPTSITAGGIATGGMQSMNVMGESSVDDGYVEGEVRLELGEQIIPNLGAVSIIADIDFDGLEADALGALKRRLDQRGRATAPASLLGAADADLKNLVAAGFNVNIKQLDLALPMGTLEMLMEVQVAETDRDSFVWTSLLQGTTANMNIKVPESLVQFAVGMNPNAGTMIAMGYLKKDGDNYIMDAKFEKGLLTINGAPLPIPLGAFQ